MFKKLLILVLICCFFSPRYAFAANEDLTSFTEVDSASDITVTSSRATFSTMQRGANSYVYKDYGAGNFDDFEHDFTVNLSAAGTSTTTSFWAVSNTIGTIADRNSANDSLECDYDKNSGGSRLFFCIDRDTDNFDSFVPTSDSWTYYLTVNQTGTTVTATVYTDSGRTTVHDTLTFTSAGTAYRYLHSVSSRDASGSNSQTGYMEDLDIKEGAAPARRIWTSQ